MLPLNRYAILARIVPAIIAAAPALALAGTLIIFTGVSLAQVITSLAVLALLYLCGDIARNQGKRLEAALYDEMGGKPSVSLLRYRDETFDDATKARYRDFLAAQIGEDPPSRSDEGRDPKASDNFYERCGNWLREKTRDPTQFRLLLEENINYGFRRNLYGLRTTATIVNIIVFIACGLNIYSDYLGLGEKGPGTIRMVMGFAVLHSIFLFIYPSRKSVITASRTYARQLILSCEGLMPPATPTTSSSKGKKKK